MDVTIENMPELRVATVHHVGPYDRISEAFRRLGAVAGPAGLFHGPNVKMVAIYHEGPENKRPDQLQSDAGITVRSGLRMPEGVIEKNIPAGCYAHTTHVGPYSQLGEVWSSTTAPHALVTDLYLPLA